MGIYLKKYWLKIRKPVLALSFVLCICVIAILCITSRLYYNVDIDLVSLSFRETRMIDVHFLEWRLYRSSQPQALTGGPIDDMSCLQEGLKLMGYSEYWLLYARFEAGKSWRVVNIYGKMNLQKNILCQAIKLSPDEIMRPLFDKIARNDDIARIILGTLTEEDVASIEKLKVWDEEYNWWH